MDQAWLKGSYCAAYLYSCCRASNPSIIRIHQASQPESSTCFLHVTMQIANGNKTRYCWKESGSHVLLHDADILKVLRCTVVICVVQKRIPSSPEMSIALEL